MNKNKLIDFLLDETEADITRNTQPVFPLADIASELFEMTVADYARLHERKRSMDNQDALLDGIRALLERLTLEQRAKVGWGPRLDMSALEITVGELHEQNTQLGIQIEEFKAALKALGADHYESIENLIKDHQEQAQFLALLIGADRSESAAPINWQLIKAKLLPERKEQ